MFGWTPGGDQSKGSIRWRRDQGATPGPGAWAGASGWASVLSNRGEFSRKRKPTTPPSPYSPTSYLGGWGVGGSRAKGGFFRGDAWLDPRNSPGNALGNDRKPHGESPRGRPHTARGPQPLATVLDGLGGAYLPRGARPSLGTPDPDAVAAALPPRRPLEPLEARGRVQVARAVERAVERALWRAERRSRLVSRKTRQTVSWVMGQRRRMSYELMRTFASMHLGDALSRQLAADASERFPRDGVVVADAPRKGSRSSGRSPRQLGTNPRNANTGASSPELPA